MDQEIEQENLRLEAEAAEKERIRLEEEAAERARLEELERIRLEEEEKKRREEEYKSSRGDEYHARLRLEELGLLPAAAEPDVPEEENTERVAPQEPRPEVIVAAESDTKFGAVGPQEARESPPNEATQTVGSVQVAVAPTEAKPKEEGAGQNVSIGTPTVPIVNPAN